MVISYVSPGGSLHLGHGYFYLRRMLLDDLALEPW